MPLELPGRTNLHGPALSPVGGRTRMTLQPIRTETVLGGQQVLSRRSLPPERWTQRARVLIARPPATSGGALERALSRDYDIQTTAGRVEEIIEAFANSGADIVVVDITWGELDLKALLGGLRTVRTDISVIVVGDQMPDEDVLGALLLDVSGLIVDPEGADRVADGVRQVLDGRIALDQRAMRRLIKSLAARLAGFEQATRQLTQRELQIVRMVGGGLTNKDIAARLSLAEGTIKVHLHNAFDKLQVRTRQALAEYAREKGLA
jgi:DNA-binding NarL/FixJ family response regulator